MTVKRRQFLMGALASSVFAKKHREGPRPNLVVIVADGLASWMLGCYGNSEIRTPNLDQLAQEGARFQNHIVCTPASSPSLATLYTGRVPRQHGIQDFLTGEPIEKPPQGQAAVPDSFRNETMLSDVLGGEGYECGFAGKWHLGDDKTPQHNFKFWYTVSPDGAPSYQDPRVNSNGQTVTEKGYLTDLISAKAAEFLDRQSAAKPFFLTVAYPNPHPPYEGHPARYYEMYAKAGFTAAGWEPPAANALRGKNYFADPVGNIRKAAAAVSALDAQIPALTGKLHQRGLDLNTLVVFTSDHGYLLGRHGLWSAGLASDPINMYDEVVQTPLIWQWLGHIPAQNVRPELVSAYDLVPTICEALDVPPPPDGRRLCGRSYLPLLTNQRFPKKSPWRATVFGQYRNTEMVRDARFKMVVRDNGAGPNEFFDLGDDPREKVNQYENEKFLGQRAQMTRALESWRKATSA